MNNEIDIGYFGKGAYSLSEAARLLRLRPENVRKWLSGYKYGAKSSENIQSKRQMPSLWQLQYPKIDEQIVLGFKDLIELKIVGEFLKQGVSLQIIRRCLLEAKSLIDDSHPFTTRQFQSDGDTIFLRQTAEDGTDQTLDLKRRQYVIRQAMEQSFKDLDISENIVASWRPFDGKKTIVIDPNRSFGQPIASDYGVPTIVLAQAAIAEGSPQAVSRLYEVPLKVVKDSILFESRLAA